MPNFSKALFVFYIISKMVFKQNAADAWTNDEKHAGTSETAISQIFYLIWIFFLKKIQVWKFIDTERPKNE